MKAILYLSKSLVDFSPEELKALEQKSAENNNKLNLSGYLYFDGGKFLQYLEGEEEDIMPLFEKIKADERHEFLCDTIEEVSERRFPAWSMKNIQTMVLEISLVEKTIIQTLSVFAESGYALNQHLSRDLFKLMDHLKSVLK